MAEIVLRLSTALLFVLMAGCATGQTTLKENNMSDRNHPSISYHVVASGAYPVDEALYSHGKRSYTIYDTDRPEELEAFRKLYGKLTEKVPPSDLNGTLIVAIYGTQSTGGYSFRVEDIREEEDVVKLWLKLEKPSSGLVTEALTNPWMVILLPDLHKKIEVVEEEN